MYDDKCTLFLDYLFLLLVPAARFAPDNGEKQEKEEKERVKTILRKVRSDPPIAPDEPVPITLRPYDVTPGDTSRDVKFVYKHALTTVHEVKRQMAVRKNNNVAPEIFSDLTPDSRLPTD